MPTLDQIRNAGEARFKRELEKLDRKHRAILLAAFERYGSVRAIPDAVWQEVKRDTEDQTVAIMLFLLIAADDWTVQEVRGQGAELNGQAAPPIGRYGLQAARRAQRMADQTVDTTRDRWARRAEDRALTGRGAVGEVLPEDAAEALDEVLNDERRETISTNETTGAISGGQIGAGRRANQVVETQLIWRSSRDDRVCPRCSPLDGKNEEVWGKVFPDGPGEAAHPNCRCELSPRVIVHEQPLAPVAESVQEHCGANAKGGGGFRQGNTCAKGGGARKKQTVTAAFRRWFGDSKVVDENGDPLVVYHGTQADFNSFDKELIKSNFQYSFGFHLTDRPTEASIYAHGSVDDSAPSEPGANVKPVYVKAINPLIIKTEQMTASMEADLNKAEIIHKLIAAQRAGNPYDSVIIKRERGDEWDGINVVVFSPTQIKSAIGNRGTFDPNNPDIREAISV